MTLRKINAVVSLVTTVLLFCHTLTLPVYLLSGGVFLKFPKILPWILFGLMMAHAIMSIVLGILGHKGAEKRKCKGYPNLNRATYLQRASGVLLILLTVLHVLGTAGPLRPPFLVHAILPPLFFIVAMMHTAISAGKALITLGIGNAAAIKIAGIVIRVLCAVILIGNVVGFYLYLV